ncbi:TonB-dependent receptor plug domain-containing protein [Pedobacter sp. Leaf194]|uniref:TonB-dependent receptor plug domain-containing protein n=1 Tax=Pedobacter sp. Leaf194 TaxID=1736297 RepID=UPI0007038E5E|nr:TonB-dependent receptor plug domain-containing protein [Pedobacter sp. Leaf194]KQS41387.1 hypothetical protein ASG14_02620 [Pedobacter sp. Leaf194]
MKAIFLVLALITGGIGSVNAQVYDSLFSKSPLLKVKGIRKPIYIIDGVKQLDSDLAHGNLIPDSIAEIKIVKNEAAIKSFGLEAADGVIFITTKSGRKNARYPDFDKSVSSEGITKISDLKFYPKPAETNSITTVDEASKSLVPASKRLPNRITDAVYILDGQKIEKDEMHWISPDSIQSISILKKDSAIAKYGPQASNGVVIITTKPGKILKGQPKPADKN